MNMIKEIPPKKTSSSHDNQVYEVEKIINQKIIQGKRTYKVVWKGYPFEDASWEPQQNLKCPEKINQFLRRYQDVVKKKNLLNKKLNDQTNPTVEKQKIPETQKIPMQKSNTEQEQKMLLSQQASSLNKQKLHASLQKNALMSQKKTPDIENLKSKIMSPQPIQNPQLTEQKILTPSKQESVPINHQSGATSKLPQNLQHASFMNQNKFSIPKSQSQSVSLKNASPDLSSSKVQQSKMSKIQNQSQSSHRAEISADKIFNKLEPKMEHQNNQRQVQSANSKRQLISRRTLTNQQRPNQILQEKKFSPLQSAQESIEEQSQQSYVQQLFLDSRERLDVQTILGIVDFGNEFQSKEGIKTLTQTPKLFMIKNKFSNQEKIVERARIINQQPLKLIDFYETLLTE